MNEKESYDFIKEKALEKQKENVFVFGYGFGYGLSVVGKKVKELNEQGIEINNHILQKILIDLNDWIGDDTLRKASELKK